MSQTNVNQNTKTVNKKGVIIYEAGVTYNDQEKASIRRRLHKLSHPTPTKTNMTLAQINDDLFG